MQVSGTACRILGERQGETAMAAFGPAGVVIFAFIGSLGTLTALYGLERLLKGRPNARR